MAHQAKHRNGKTDPQLEAALQRLQVLIERAPDLGDLAAFYRTALPVMRRAQGDTNPLTLDVGLAGRKLTTGIPLLVGEDLPLDPQASRDLLLELCRIAETVGASDKPRSRGLRLSQRVQPGALELIDRARDGDDGALRAAAAARIRRLIEHNELDTFAVMSALATGEWRRIDLMVAEFALDADLLRMLAQNTLKPPLRAWTQSLKDIVSVDRWQRGQCPFCGSPPALAELRGKEGTRYQRCVMCGADWPYPRLQCAFCGNHDYRSLNYIRVEGEAGKYRVQACDQCHGYLKIIVAFEPTPVEQLIIEDLATLHLDLIAVERDFTQTPVQ